MRGDGTTIRPVPTVWDDRYDCPKAASFLSTRKQREVVARARRLGLLELRSIGPYDEERTWAEIARRHSPDYVAAVRTGAPRHRAESQGFSWCPELADAVARIWAGHGEACRLAIEEGLVFHPVSGAHHARRATGGGFCTFNYLVGGPLRWIEQGRIERVLVVDLDTHQGNGTWELAGDDPRFALFDVAGAPFGVAPVETDRRFARIVRDAEAYRRALEELPARIEAFGPDLAEVQAGVDCHEDDLVGGIPGMDAAALRERDLFVFEALRSRGVPTVFNLAGGYQSMEATVALHVGTVEAALAVEAESRRRGAR